MIEINIQPFSFYVGSMIAGLFTGFALAVGNTIVKIWVEPKFKKMKKDKLHRKLFVRNKKVLSEKKKKVLKTFIIVALVLLVLIFVINTRLDNIEAHLQEERFNECLSYCFNPMQTEANPLTRSSEFCASCFLSGDLALALTEATQ